MDRLIFVFFVAAAVLTTGCGASRNTLGAKGGGASTEIVKMLEDRDYSIAVTSILGKRNISLSSPYNISVKGVVVNSYLPFFGRATSIPYGGGEGLIFEEAMENYSMNYNGKDGSYSIYFKVNTKEDIHDFNIRVYPDGSCSIYVNSLNRQSIEYRGSLDI